MSDWSELPSTTTTTLSKILSQQAYPPTEPQSIGLEQHCSANLTTASDPCPFLDLPTEMRLDIYELALLDAPSAISGLPLLQTCRHVSMEARPTLYKRPTSFTSQARLFAWIGQSRKQDLKRVRTLTLRLTDIDLSSLLDQPSTLSLQRRTRASVYTLYQAEIERLDDAFKALPNLSSLTIVPPKAGRSKLLKGLYHSFLALIPMRCPKLRRLEVQDGEEVLEAVPALKDVAGITCTGSCRQSSVSRKGLDGPAPAKRGETDGAEGAYNVHAALCASSPLREDRPGTRSPRIIKSEPVVDGGDAER